MTTYQCGKEKDDSHHCHRSNEGRYENSRKASELKGAHRESTTQEKHHQRHT